MNFLVSRFRDCLLCVKIYHSSIERPWQWTVSVFMKIQDSYLWQYDRVGNKKKKTWIAKARGLVGGQAKVIYMTIALCALTKYIRRMETEEVVEMETSMAFSFSLNRGNRGNHRQTDRKNTFRHSYIAWRQVLFLVFHACAHIYRIYPNLWSLLSKKKKKVGWETPDEQDRLTTMIYVNDTLSLFFTRYV